ncbi:hypothetical protein MANI_019538 [Metarhizium anisopliae]|nr:hypothetical protein MANI_019538 [Metarhizium anisopliae]
MTMPSDSSFRAHLPDLNTDRLTAMREQDCHQYAVAFKEKKNPPWLHALYEHWQDLLSEPFKGITANGRLQPDLFKLEDQGIPIEHIVQAAKLVTFLANKRQRQTLSYHIDSPEWRTWSNPEFLISDKGIRLDDSDVTLDLREAIINVLRATLSPEGFEKAIGATRINGFLGDLVQAPGIMNEFAYNFVLFGSEPSTTRPWGFSFYGHHLCLNVFFYKQQMVLSPWFTGAEPNIIDSGPYKGTRILHTEEALGLQLMQSLPQDVQSRVQTYKHMKDAAMPYGRWNHDDQRHLCGAYRDNRIVPYEGVPVSEFTQDQRDLVDKILHQYLLYLPEKARLIRLAHIKSLYHETYFSWIGGFANEDAFYYRLQSPVVIIEFDHHSGVFLTNEEPAKFHIHTLLRTPNGGDYGMALRPLIPGAEQNFQWKQR